MVPYWICLFSGCLTPNCEERVWTITSTRTHFDQSLDDNMDQSTRLIYTFSHNTVVLVRKEIQLYTLASFFADFGGYLGLLLGESLVSYLLRVAHWIKKLKQKYQHKKIAYKNEQTTTGSVLSKYKKCFPKCQNHGIW